MARQQHAIIIGLEVAGCKDDVRNVRSWLGQSIGINSTTTLEDGNATATSIAGAISEQAARLANDDFLVIYFSGHGGEKPGQENRSDADGKSQVMYVANNEKLTDAALWELWRKFRIDVRILFISDSCHSEGLAGTFSQNPVKASLVHMSACSNNEESRGGNGTGGRFTNAMIQTHAQATNYLDWCNRINVEVFKKLSTQLAHCNSYGANRKVFVQQKPMDLNAKNMTPGVFDF